MQAGHRHPYEGFHCNLYIEGYITVIITIQSKQHKDTWNSLQKWSSCTCHSTVRPIRNIVQSHQSEPFQYAKMDFYIYKDHKIFIAQNLNVIGNIRSIQVELIEDVLLFRSDDLYCHGVLHATYLPRYYR